jgi:hypothetical protein
MKKAFRVKYAAGFSLTLRPVEKIVDMIVVYDFLVEDISTGHGRLHHADALCKILTDTTL